MWPRASPPAKAAPARPRCWPRFLNIGCLAVDSLFYAGTLRPYRHRYIFFFDFYFSLSLSLSVSLCLLSFPLAVGKCPGDLLDWARNFTLPLSLQLWGDVFVVCGDASITVSVFQLPVYRRVWFLGCWSLLLELGCSGQCYTVRSVM